MSSICTATEKVVSQSIEWLQEDPGTDWGIQEIVYMEMDEVSYEVDVWPWTPEDVEAMIARVTKAIQGASNA